jgi:hypothetical protein
MPKDKEYLGDGLYARHDGYQFWLSAEDGIRVTNEVALEPDVLHAFVKFIERTLNVKVKITPVEEEGRAEEGADEIGTGCGEEQS